MKKMILQFLKLIPFKLSFLLISNLLSQNTLAHSICEDLFKTTAPRAQTQNAVTNIMLAKKLAASWEISRQGVGE